MKFDIRLKLVTFTFGVVLLVGGSIAFYFIYQERQRILTTFEQEARETTAMISRTVTNDLYFLNLYSLRLRLEEARMDPDISYLYATDLQGVVLADGSGKNARRDQRLTDSFSREMLHSGGWISRQEEGVLKIGGPILTPDNRRIGYLHTGFSLRRVDEFVHRTTTTSFYITMICLGIGAILADFLSMAFSRPILSIARAAKEIGGGRLDARLSIKRGDEVGMLAESINQMADQIQRHLQQITVLREIEQAVNSTLDLRAVLNLLLEKIDLLLPYSAASVRLLNRDTGVLEPVACRNIDEEEWKKETAKDGSGLGKVVFESKKPLMIVNVQTDLRARNPEFARKHGLVSYVGVPLVAKDEVLGILAFYTREERAFTSEEIEFLTTLAAQAAIAIYNSQLYDQTKIQAAELEKVNKLQADLTAMVAHDLRGPLAVIVGASAMLEEGLGGQVNEEQKKWLVKIGAHARRLADLVNEFLDVSKIEAGHFDLVKEKVDLAELIRNSLASYLVLAREKNISITSQIASTLPLIWADPTGVDRILGNLLSNAIKFTREGGAIEVGVSLENEKEVKLWVKDNGVGIPSEEISQIFEKYRQAKNREISSYKGTGLGLFICKTIAEAHGGNIWAESEPGKGSTFTVTIPYERNR